MRKIEIKKVEFYPLILVTIFLLWLLYSIIVATGTLPSEGDSINLHIPLAKSLLSEKLYKPDPGHDILYPASIELILLFFIVGHIPLNLFNILAIVAMFIGVYLLGKSLGFSKGMSLVFSVATSFLHALVRWSQTQKPDIWMLTFFVFMLWLVHKRNKKGIDYLLMGICSGFFIGAKFTSPLFFLIFVFLFKKKFFNSITINKSIIFLIPFLIIGCFWYVRNVFIVGSPIYLEGYSFFSKEIMVPLTDHAWNGYLHYPNLMLDAYVSEYSIWGFGLMLIPFWLLNKRSDKKISKIVPYYFLALFVFLISLMLPFWGTYTQIVGTMRYTFPMIFLLILCCFLIADYYKKEHLLMQIVVVVVLVSIMPNYHPKIVLLIVPLLLLYHFRSTLLIAGKNIFRR